MDTWDQQILMKISFVLNLHRYIARTVGTLETEEVNVQCLCMMGPLRDVPLYYIMYCCGIPDINT